MSQKNFIGSIKNNLINPTYYADIKKSLRGSEFWKSVADVSETFSKVIAGGSTILAFASGFYQITTLSFLAGCLGTTSLLLLHFSAYSYAESKDKIFRVDKILKILGVKNIETLEKINIVDDIIETKINTAEDLKGKTDSITEPKLELENLKD